MSEVLKSPKYARAKKFNSTDGIKEFLEKCCEIYPTSQTPLKDLWLAYLLYWGFYTPEDYLNNHSAYVRFSMNLHGCLPNAFFARHSKGVVLKSLRLRAGIHRDVEETKLTLTANIPIAGA